jgi:signal-transduction protein with cAMP-binding, CBS, and nucleotidyltransferase domain
MNLEDLGDKNPITIEKSANLQKASEIMKERHVGSLLVLEDYNVGKQQKLCGVINERDVSLALTLDIHPGNILVESVMRSHPVTMKKNDSIFEVAAEMKKHSIRRMPVLNEDDSLFGIISADDLLSIFSKQISNLSSLTSEQLIKENGVNVPSQLHGISAMNNGQVKYESST